MPATPTPFVAEVVYPRLERGAAALDAQVLSGALRTFVDDLAPAYVLADFPNDIRLLCAVLASDGTNERPTLVVVTTIMDKEGSTAERVEAWFRARPTLAAPAITPWSTHRRYAWPGAWRRAGSAPTNGGVPTATDFATLNTP